MLTLEYKLTIITDDDKQGYMSDEDLEETITHDVQKWTPSLGVLPLIKSYHIEEI